MLQVIREGICNPCLRPYHDRMWTGEEVVRRNPGSLSAAAHEQIALRINPRLERCPLNCKWLVEFADNPIAAIIEK